MPENPGALATVRKILCLRIPLTPLAFFFDSVSLLLNTGTSIPDAFLGASDLGDSELRNIFEIAAPKMRYGASLSSCLREYADRFPEIVMPLIDVGEASGGMQGQTKRLADTFKMQVDAERKFKFNVYHSRMIFFAFCALAIIVTGIISFVAPEPGVSPLKLAVHREIMILCAITWLLFLSIIGRWLAKLVQNSPPLSLFASTLKLAIPGFGTVARDLSAARWARSYGTLISAGVNISQALEISSRSALNAHYEKALLDASARTRTGVPLSACLRDTQLLPSHLITIIVTCEQVGRLDENLVRYAADMEEEALHKGIESMNRLVVGMQFMFLLLAALVILTMAASS